MNKSPIGRRVRLCREPGCETLTTRHKCSRHRVAEETKRLLEKVVRVRVLH